jgi:hypothetical protein
MLVRGIPQWFLLAKWFFGGLGYRGQKPRHFPEDRGSLALPPLAARPNKYDFLENVWFVWPWCPRPPKESLGQNNHFGTPLSYADFQALGPKICEADRSGARSGPTPFVLVLGACSLRTWPILGLGRLRAPMPQSGCQGLIRIQAYECSMGTEVDYNNWSLVVFPCCSASATLLATYLELVCSASNSCSVFAPPHPEAFGALWEASVGGWGSTPNFV